MASDTPRSADSLAAARRLASLHPEGAEPQHQLGMALASHVDLKAAVAPLTRVTWLAPARIDGHINLGIALIELQRFEHAIASLRRALAAAPSDADIHHGLGVAAAALGRLREAGGSLRRALGLQPARAETMVRLANVLIGLRQPGEAAAFDRRAVCLVPSRGPAHFDLGVALAHLERHRQAVTSSLRALGLEPQSTQALVNAAASLVLLGETRRAVSFLKKAAFADGAGPDPFRNLMAVMSYDAGIGEEERWAAARAFADRHSARPSPAGLKVSHDSERRLTIGYLSSDLYSHAVARCLGPIIAAHDRTRYRLVCYAAGEATDTTTEQLRCNVDGWRNVAHLSDGETARLVREDRIDILVIVGGRFDHNRPLVASHRAAPVQVSLFDGGTSGLQEMDYLLADRVLVAPMGQRRERFAERVLRLPTVHLYAPSSDLVPAREPPSVKSGVLSFGCFSNPMKIGRDVLQLWKRVLTSVPGSTLTLKYMTRYADADLRQRILNDIDLDPTRLRFLAADDSMPDHLRRYEGIDIALDTLPFTGSTTAWEALDMGVPVVTLLGDNIVGRLSASLLRPIGLAELIARDHDDYVRIAKSLAEDRDRLARLRAGLRERIERSPLCNARVRARQFERIYRAIWRRWCVSGRGAVGPAAAGSGR
ncbi:MAG: tetratricopeptide repeat protein [Alphaproteobacteria bacterium]|nr:tetratricopeptide repeat protein [Alphaproteobacteria bacterium]